MCEENNVWMSKIALAPCLDAASICFLEMMKSFISTGTRWIDATSSSWRLPLKYFGSVITESAAAPPFRYLDIKTSGSCTEMLGLDGEAFFTSATMG